MTTAGLRGCTFGNWKTHLGADWEAGQVWTNILRTDGSGTTSWPLIKKARNSEATFARQAGTERSGLEIDFIIKIVNGNNEIELAPTAET